MFIGEWLNVCEMFIDGGVTAAKYLFTPLPLINISPILLITFGGLSVFLSIAITKWLLI